MIYVVCLQKERKKKILGKILPFKEYYFPLYEIIIWVESDETNNSFVGKFRTSYILNINNVKRWSGENSRLTLNFMISGGTK